MQCSAFRTAPYKIPKSIVLLRPSATRNFREFVSLGSGRRIDFPFAIASELRAIRVRDENQKFASLAASQSFIAKRCNRRDRTLGAFVDDLGNLCPKKPSAAGRRMADAVCVHIKFFQLSSGDFSQRDDLIARK